MQLVQELPESILERAQMLQGLMIARATGGGSDTQAYLHLRDGFLADEGLKPLLPSFVRTSRSLEQFWAYIKTKFGTYEERRAHIWEAFQPLLDRLEGRNKSPSDREVGEVLSTFDTDGTHAAWQKALGRRQDDPDGAITAARTLLETVCKRILEAEQCEYDEHADLPTLYFAAAQTLGLAPSQHTEIVFKKILGNCQQIVNGLGTLRNKIGDAHGRGGAPIRPAPRHAALAVNLAGTMATFLVETWLARQS